MKAMLMTRRATLILVLGAAPALLAQERTAISLADAVRLTLQKQPDVQLLERQVEIAAGDLETQKGAFDSLLGANATRTRDKQPLNSANAVGSFDELQTDSTRVGASVSQLFRSGLTITPSVQFDRTGTNVPMSILENRTTVRVTATQPLLRGRGAAAVAAGERAQGHELTATRADYRFGVSQTVLRTVQTYWNYLAAARALEIVRGAEDRFASMADEAQALIAADQMPAADAKQLQANLASRTASRLQAEQSLYEARQAFGLALGLPADQIDALALPADEFPPVPSSGLPRRGDEGLFLAEALQRRGDLDAARTRVLAADVLRESARNATKPRVDLQLLAGYKGLSEGGAFGNYFSPFTDRTSGLDAAASLQFQFPPRNRAAEGALAHSAAVSEQARIQAWDRERQVRSGLAVAVSSVQTAAERVAVTADTARLFTEAVEDERQKLRLALGTVIDLIQTQLRDRHPGDRGGGAGTGRQPGPDHGPGTGTVGP
jgi:outer membrane protein TolC